MLDMSKKFMYVEDNEDDTITITMNLGEAFDGALKDVQVVQKGSIEEIIAGMIGNVTPEQIVEFEKSSIVIPNEVPVD